MNQGNKDACQVNNYFYIVINDESKIPDLKNNFQYFNHLQKTIQSKHFQI